MSVVDRVTAASHAIDRGSVGGQRFLDRGKRQVDFESPHVGGRERRTVGAVGIWCVSREGLIGMKAWANRPRDLDDIARLRDNDR